MERYDMVAIGGGAAGLVTAAGAAGLGARTALIERDRLGGECLWTGCVPSKALIAAARAAADTRSAARFGVAVTGMHVDFARVMAHVHDAQQRIAPHDSAERFRQLGVDVIAGVARFVGDRVLDIDGRRVAARHVVIATGTSPAVPPIPGLAAVPYLTNESVFELGTLPGRLLVLGGGAVGLELAQAFARLGSRVTVVELAPRLLARDDTELVERLHARLQAEGVELRVGVRVARVARDEAGIALHMQAGPAPAEILRGDALLVAAGRTPDLAALDHAVAGIEAVPDGVRVDARLRTSARNVWAAGGVVAGAPRFTHVADYHARLVLRNALFPLAARVDYAAVPWVTFTDPPLAGVGLTEAAARERYGERVTVWTREFGAVDRGIADGRTDGLLKVIAGRRGRLLGGHVFGQGADSVIAEIALALRQRLTLADIAATVHAYPTYPEAFRHAADAWNRTRLRGPSARLVRWLVRRV